MEPNDLNEELNNQLQNQNEYTYPTANKTSQSIQAIGSISEIQIAISHALHENDYFVKRDVPIICENQKDIIFQMQTALGNAGILVTISTPDMTFGGMYTNTQYAPEPLPYWEITNGVITVVENPVLNRAKAMYATAQDAALQIAQTISKIPSIQVRSISQTSSDGAVIATIDFQTNITFIYKDDSRDTQDDSEES